MVLAKIRLPGRPPGRLSQVERRSQILKVARKEFTRLGYRGTTTRRLAQVIGITEVTLFRYFPTKEALYAEVLEAYSSEAKIRELVTKASKMSLERGLEYLAAEILVILRSQMPLTKLALIEGQKRGQRARLVFRKQPQKYLAAVEQFLRIQRRRKALRHVNVALTARAFLSMFFAFAVLQQILRVYPPKRQSARSVVKTFADIFMYGIARHRKSGRRAGHRKPGK